MTDIQGYSSNRSFNLVVYSPPTFTASLSKQIDLMASNYDSYTLPVNIAAVGESVVHQSLPSFATFNFPTYTFYPNKINYLGLTIINGILINPYEQVPF